MSNDLLIDIIRTIVLGGILSLDFFFPTPPFPTNFLIITGAAFIISLVIVAWDIYEWRTAGK